MTEAVAGQRTVGKIRVLSWEALEPAEPTATFGTPVGDYVLNGGLLVVAQLTGRPEIGEEVFLRPDSRNSRSYTPEDNHYRGGCDIGFTNTAGKAGTAGQRRVLRIPGVDSDESTGIPGGLGQDLAGSRPTV